MKYFIMYICLFFVINNAIANTKFQTSHMKMCKGQIQLYCEDVGKKNDLREIMKCLAKNDVKLSVECPLGHCFGVIVEV